MTRLLQTLVAWWRQFYDHKVEQAKAPQAQDLEWMKQRADRVETELQTVRRAAGREAWRM